MWNGIVNVYKEAGFTSHDVVAKLRGIYGLKKIGHTGTLDPDAEGVLPICLGRATKVCDLLTDRTKTYRAKLLLGKETDTQDTSGTVLQTSGAIPDASAVREAIRSFEGDIMQIPPMYSARKINGKKLYEYAREGIEVERAARAVHIYKIDIEEITLPYVTMSVTCSKGTYIRTLCHDIGQKLGCGGCMAHLLRTQVGEFTLKSAVKLAELQQAKEEGTLGNYVQSTDTLFRDHPALIFKSSARKRVQNGNFLTAEDLVDTSDLTDETSFRLYDEAGRFIGIYIWHQDQNRLDARKILIDFH